MTDVDVAPNGDIQLDMQRRIRRHLLLSFAGALAGLAVVALAGALIGEDPSRRVILTACVVLGIAIIPVVGFTSAVTLLRCPACNANVGLQVSANMSAFAGRAAKTCDHCGRKIFMDVRSPGRKLRMVALVTLGVLVALVILALLRQS